MKEEVSCSRYILRGKIPFVERDLIAWGKWFEDINNRIVKQEFVGKKKISTVFLGIDHNFFGGKPVLFETMVFDKDEGALFQQRYETWEDAEKEHKKIVKRIENGEVL